MPNDWQSDPQGYLSELVGSPVQITSGLRDPQHNAAVGGVPNSAHLSGQAFDFVPQGGDMKSAAAKLAQSGVPFDQVINEGNHIHVSFAQTNRRQVLGQTVAQNDPNDAFSAAFGGGKSASANPGPGAPQDGDAFSAAFGKVASAPAKGVAALPPPVDGAKPVAPGKVPFGFQGEIMAHVPFAKDAAAGVPALLERGANALEGKQGPSLKDIYQSNLAGINSQQAQYENQNPNLSNAATGVGLLATGGPAKAGISAIPQTLGQLVKGGAKAGATLGGLFGLGTPTEGDQTVSGRAGNALTGATLGGVTGGAIPVAGAAIGQGARLAGAAGNKLFPPVQNQAAAKAKSIIESFAGGPVTPNAAQLVPGSQPNLAEATANPGVAALTRAIRDINPNSPLIAREGQNAAARTSFLESVTGTPEDIEKAVQARDLAAKGHLNQVFSSAQPADVTPVHQEINSILNGPSGARPAVKSALKDVQSILDNDGKPITDPETLYNSARKGIDDLIGGKDLTKGYGAQAARELLSVKDKLDDVIDKSAPGFKQYLQDYATSSQPITSMKFLQGQNLTDSKGNITLGKVQSALRRLQDQQNAPGVKAGKAVTDTQVAGLESLRDDLLRAQNISLGRAVGSNTVQNAMAQQRLGLARHIDPELTGKGVGSVVGGGLGSIFGPAGAGGGAAVGASLGGTLGRLAGARSAAKNALMQSEVQRQIEDQLLNPGNYTKPNIAPSVIPSLNQILNGRKSLAAMGLANRLLSPQGARTK